MHSSTEGMALKSVLQLNKSVILGKLSGGIIYLFKEFIKTKCLLDASELIDTGDFISNRLTLSFPNDKINFVAYFDPKPSAANQDPFIVYLNAEGNQQIQDATSIFQARSSSKRRINMNRDHGLSNTQGMCQAGLKHQST